MCIFCEKDIPLLSTSTYTDSGDVFSVYVDIKNDKLRVKMIRENAESIEDVCFDEDVMKFCPACGKKLS